MRKSTARVVRRVNENALHLSGEFLLERLKCQQVVPEDQSIVEDVRIRHAVPRVIRPFGVRQ